MIEGHGDDTFRYGDKVRVNFSTNIHQSVDHSALMHHLASCQHLLSNYPEPEPRSVEMELGKRHNTSPDNIIVTNGATEAIYLIARKMQRKRSVIVVPTFREYQDACAMNDHDITFISEDDFQNGDFCCGNRDVVWVCNPNNPTGRVYERGQLLNIIDSMPDTLFVVDQAYGDYSMTDVLTVEDVVTRNNIVMLHSLTKQFAIPGLRIGYAIASAEIITALRSLRMPWSVNAFAIEAANYLLTHNGNYEIQKAELHQEALRIGNALRKMGIACSDTKCNFLLCRLPKPMAAELKEWLIVHRGLLIRDASNFETLNSCYFRVAAQTREENDLLIKSIEEWMSL